MLSLPILLSSNELNSFNPKNETYNCIALAFDDTEWECINKDTGDNLKFLQVTSASEAANVYIKVEYENDEGLEEIALFIDNDILTFRVSNELVTRTVNIDDNFQDIADLIPGTTGFMTEKSNEFDYFYEGYFKINEDKIVVPFGKGEIIYTDFRKVSGSFNGISIEGKYYDEKEKYTFIGQIDIATGSRFGEGEIFFDSGNYFKGIFSDDAANGIGEDIFADGETFVGEFFYGERNGHGYLKFGNGDTYEGTLKNGSANGFGIYTYKDPAEPALKKYYGEFIDDKFTGIGSYFDDQGRITYQGEVEDGAPAGHGTSTYYIDEQKEVWIGKHISFDDVTTGKAFYANGSYAEGSFKDGNLHGLNILIKGGVIYEGIFVEGTLNGLGKATFKEFNTVYEGNFTNGFMDGAGAGTDTETGERFTLVFKNGDYISGGDSLPLNFNPNKRIALVIGNDDYINGPLNNAVNDSVAIKLALEKSGFEVIHIANATRNDFQEKLDLLDQKIKQYGSSTTSLFYYSGHAAQIDGINYLYPTDAVIRRKADLELSAININKVFSILNNNLQGVKIVILDACRNNPYSSFTRSANKGMAQMKTPAGTIIGYSTGPGETAIDGGMDGLSIYTGNLVKNINRQNQTIENVFKETRKSVAKQTNNQQIPWVSSSLISDFYFNKEN